MGAKRAKRDKRVERFLGLGVAAVCAAGLAGCAAAGGARDGQPGRADRAGAARSPTTAPTTAEAADESRPAALQALRAYRAAKRLPDVPGAARLGDPIPNVWVRLDELKNPGPGAAPGAALAGGAAARVIYPVQGPAGAADSVVVQKAAAGWEPAAVGGDFLGAALAQLREKNRAATGKPAGDYYALSVPALNAHFLAYRDAGKVWLIPVIDYPEFQLKAGQPVQADDVAPKLIAAARAHEDKPR